MRNPDRLKPIYDHIKGIHKEHFPKLEFGPFIKKFFDWYKQDPFYVEDCLSGLDMAYDYLCDMHKKHLPDWRFFQLMFNVFSEYGEELTKCDDVCTLYTVFDKFLTRGMDGRS